MILLVSERLDFLSVLNYFICIDGREEFIEFFGEFGSQVTNIGQDASTASHLDVSQ
jgi:hypothetical protein